ncbi:MAG: thrombospondin type 3 repeat-containing protein [Acidobacteriota bacterium]
MPPHDEGIDVQLFDYAIGPKTFFTVDNAEVAREKTLALDFLVTFLTSPFTVYNSSGSNNPSIIGTRDEVVQNMTVGQLTGAYGVTDKIQIGANLPFVFRTSGQGLTDPNLGMGVDGGLAVTGLGDLLVEGKMRLYQQDELALAGIAGLTLPTGFGSDGSKFIGDPYPTLHLRGAINWASGKVAVGGTLGFIFRDPQHFYGTTIGQQLTFGAGGAYALTDRFSAVGELYGRLGLQDASENNSPVEAVGGVRIGVADAVAVTIGGGGGLDHAIGAPELRVFGSVSFAPGMYKPIKAEAACPEGTAPDGISGCADATGDRDHDGIPDKEDKCPDQPEDHDGFEDDDGCPDLDNDKDGIPDLQDRCPNDAEDGKEPYPKDGCPGTKRDSDGDGIPDAYDQCPLEEEDFDNFEDGDGCPDLDNDHDGIPDAADKCPVCPEDKDGVEDQDGCPDPDNDHDGIPDSQDQCPTQPETVNGIKDDDGCPDAGPQIVKLDGDRLTIDKLPTIDRKGNLTRSGEAIAAQIALVMRGASVDVSFGHPTVTKWLLAISMRNAKDAQKLGDALKAYLDKKGIRGVEALGAAGPSKIGGVVQERVDVGSDAAPFTCPAGMEVKPRPEAATPKGLMPGAQPPAPATPATPAAAPPAAAAPAATPPAAAAPAPAPAPPPAAKPEAKKPESKKAPAAPAQRPASNATGGEPEIDPGN